MHTTSQHNERHDEQHNAPHNSEQSIRLPRRVIAVLIAAQIGRASCRERV